MRTNRMTLVAVLMLAACGGEPVERTLAEQCEAVALDYCCGLDDELDAAECFSIYFGKVCAFPGGDIVRSSVDFDACNAALDAQADRCSAGYEYVLEIDTMQRTGLPLPSACETSACADGDVCAEGEF